MICGARTADSHQHRREPNFIAQDAQTTHICILFALPPTIPQSKAYRYAFCFVHSVYSDSIGPKQAV